MAPIIKTPSRDRIERYIVALAELTAPLLPPDYVQAVANPEALRGVIDAIERACEENLWYREMIVKALRRAGL